MTEEEVRALLGDRFDLERLRPVADGFPDRPGRELNSAFSGGTGPLQEPPWRSGVDTTGVRRRTPLGAEALAARNDVNAARSRDVLEWRSTRLLLEGAAPLA